MKEYDVVVIGSGAGALIIDNAITHNMSVALVDKGPLGGTCLNLGCIPSKMLIFPADRIVEIEQSRKLGIKAEIANVDFKEIMERMRRKINAGERRIYEAVTHAKELDFYHGEARFIGDYTLEVDGKKLKGRKVFIAAGARPHIPQIAGIAEVDYLTNESVLELKERPESMVIIGGGYIAAEYGHFFAAVGVKITIIQRNKKLLPGEEPEISDQLVREMRKRMDIHTGMEAIEVRRANKGNIIIATNNDSGNKQEFTGETVLVVTGRQSNADILRVKNTGVDTDEKDYIRINHYFETSKKNIWAFGDIIGKEMFRHVANREATLAWQNAIHKEKVKMDYGSSPHAIFTYPEIASVGLREEEARNEYGHGNILVGKALYSDVAMGEAMMEEEGFAKAIVERNTGKILGFHIIGPYASMLIQEVINAMAVGGDLRLLSRGMHIHPALSELIISTLNNLKPV